MYIHTSSTFGVHRFYQEDDPKSNNECSHTGIIFYPKKKLRTKHLEQWGKDAPPMVLSFVNGTMCVNPLGEPVYSCNFDAHAMDVLDSGYRMPKQNEPAVAYFDFVKLVYTSKPVPWP
jgi:hypothetical protein